MFVALRGETNTWWRGEGEKRGEETKHKDERGKCRERIEKEKEREREREREKAKRGEKRGMKGKVMT